jgi:hypothetical protein
MTELRLHSLVSYNLRSVAADSVRETREKLSACRVHNRLRGRQTYEKSGCALREGNFFYEILKRRNERLDTKIDS